MKSIKSVLLTLKETDVRALQYAFQHQIPYHIVYEKGKYIGVNAENIQYLNIEQTAGRWSCGTIKDNKEKSDGKS